MMANETSSNFSIISSTISASCTDSSDHKENAFMDYWIDGVLKICGGCFGSIMSDCYLDSSLRKKNAKDVSAYSNLLLTIR